MHRWRDEAVCKDLPFETQKVFFGEAPDVPTHSQHELARKHCYTCPVQVDCLAYCVDTDTNFGVWGGLTESQRKRYLWPAIRQLGYDWSVLELVISERGASIFKLLAV